MRDTFLTLLHFTSLHVKGITPDQTSAKFFDKGPERKTNFSLSRPHTVSSTYSSLFLKPVKM